MILRPAERRDAARICAIANPIIRDSLITFTTLQRTQEGVCAAIDAAKGAFLVAEDRGEVFGFASLAAFRPGPGYDRCKEHSIQLAPQARGQGVGRALMHALEEVARAQDVHTLIAGISGANPDAVAFHAVLGFQEVGRLPEVGRKQGQWLDLILMQKTL